MWRFPFLEGRLLDKRGVYASIVNTTRKGLSRLALFRDLGRDAELLDSQRLFALRVFVFMLQFIINRKCTHMRVYEILYLVGESKKTELESIRKSVEEAIVALGGEVEAGEFVDERRMEYAIQKERRGTYIAKRFSVKDEISEDVPGALTKKLSFNKNILRFLIVSAEGLPTLEDSQDRVKRIPDTRRRPQGRYQSNRPRPSQQPAPLMTPDAPTKPALSDTEIDKKLGELLDA